MCTGGVVPNQTETVALIVALLENARGLLSDAKVLLRHDRHARGFVLSVLAREEAGKALLVLAREMGDADIQSRQMTNHREKLLSAATGDILLVGELSQLPEAAQGLASDKTHDEKMAGLYVDWREGELRTPACIEPEQAAEAYAGASALLDRLDPIFGRLTPEALSVAQLLDQELRQVLDQYGETAGMVATVELARRMIKWGTSQKEASIHVTEAARPTRNG